MCKAQSLAALLAAVHRNNGYSLSVRSVKEINGIVYIGLSNPPRKAVITENAYEKIKDYLVVDRNG